MNPSGHLEQQDVPHAAAVQEGADRAEDLFEVLAGASLVDPHVCSLAAASQAPRGLPRIGWLRAGGPVEQAQLAGASFARSEDRDRRECNERPGHEQGAQDRRCVQRRGSGDSRPRGRRAVDSAVADAKGARPAVGGVNGGRVGRRRVSPRAPPQARPPRGRCSRSATMFALTEAPPVISATRASSQGVTAAPEMPGLVRLADRLLDGRAGDVERQGVRLRDRVADHEPGRRGPSPRGRG